MDDSQPYETGREPTNEAILLCNDASRRHAFALIARGCGIAAHHADFADADPQMNAAKLCLIDFPSISEQCEGDLSNITRYLSTSGADALIWTDMDRLDAAYALFPTAGCHFLVDVGDVEAMLILAMANGRSTMNQLQDNSRDGGYGDLHKISDELAGFAKTLARIASQDDDDGNMPGFGALSDKPVSFRPAPAAAFQPMVEECDISAQEIRDLIRMRRLRETHFEAGLFADPAWDILLDLMAARLEGKKVSVSSLCIAAAVPPTTALRWITGMTQNGMLERKMDEHDARRVFIELSEMTTANLCAYFAQLRQNGFTI